MDVILEVADQFLWDHLYAFVHPARPAPYDYPNQLANATTHSTWQYKPSTAFINLTPSSAAYASAWDRENIYRQSISMFLMIWYDII